MGFPIQIDSIRMGMSILYFKGSHVRIPNNERFLSLKIVFIVAYSAVPDEILHHASNHLGLPYLPKYLFMGILHKKS